MRKDPVVRLVPTVRPIASHNIYKNTFTKFEVNI